MRTLMRFSRARRKVVSKTTDKLGMRKMTTCIVLHRRKRILILTVTKIRKRDVNVSRKKKRR
jgi:hypothetical protein